MKIYVRDRTFFIIALLSVILLSCMIPASASATSDIKISVDADGIYLITYTDLQNAGLDLSTIDPQTIKITNQGSEIPVYIYGEGDGVFDAADFIEFYGAAIPRDSVQFEFTATNVYWLTSESSPGLRMDVKDGTPSGSAAVPTSFNVTVHVEEDTYYWQSIPNGEGKDHWFWGDKIYAPSSNNYTVDLNNISSGASDAVVRVNLHGRTSTVNNPDHHTKIYLNGYLIDDQYWDGQIQFLHEVTVPHSYLVNGTNTIKLESVNDTGALIDIIHMDWFEIDFYDTFVAENDFLDFLATDPGTFEFQVSNFTDDIVEVFDITDPNNVMRVVNNITQLDGSTYTTRFDDSVTLPPARYSTINSSQRKTPADMLMDTPSDLKSTLNGADFIIITYDGFYDNILPLEDFYQNKGLRVITVKVTDIYDEFSYGIFDPQAIKSFLEYAYFNWVSPAPLYVLLVGDANIDYKDNFGMGNMNYVPTHLFETTFLGQTPGDNWFVSISGVDILPDMFIGRLSVQTSTELYGVVNKIIDYQSTQSSGWNANVQFVADDELQFEELSDDLAANYLPAEYTVQKVYMSQYASGSDAKSAIKSNIDNGTLITNYTGHGSVDNWAGEYMFETSDVASLSNAGKLTFVTTLNCLNGFFPLPLSPWQPSEDRTSLAEEFLKQADKGAIAVFAPTGLGYPSEHDILAQELFSALFNDRNIVLGNATTQAKISAFSNGVSSDVVETFVFFGDPAVRLKTQDAEPTYALSIIKAGIGTGTVTSSPAGINCGSDCLETYDNGTVVDLTPSPDAGSTFTGWSSDADCTDGVVTMNDNKTCTATFELQSYTLDITKAGTGIGTVTSSPSGIDCGTDCSEDYTSGTEVTLTEAPDAASTFAGWSGDADCSDGVVTMDASKTCSATFDITQYQLTTYITPSGAGSVTPECSGGCWYDSGTIVILTANEDSGYPFIGWTWCDDASNNVCTMTMNADKDVTVIFDSCQYPVRIMGETPAYYSALQDAYDGAGDGDTIQSRAISFTEDLNINRSTFVTLEGGYDCDYTTKAGNTTLIGNTTINNGTTAIEDFILE